MKEHQFRRQLLYMSILQQVYLGSFNVGWENQGTNIIDPQVDEKPHIEQKYHRLAGKCITGITLAFQF